MVRAVAALLALMLVLPACEKNKGDAPNAGGETTAAQPETADGKEADPNAAKSADAKAAADANADSQWVSSPFYGVKFRAPKAWKVAADGEAMSVTSPDSAITILLVGSGSEGVMSAAMDAVKKQLEFKDVKLEKDSQTVLNGMPGHTAEGSAVLVTEDGDQEIQFILNAVQPGDKGVAMMVFAEAEMYEAKKEELQGITKTLQKL